MPAPLFSDHALSARIEATEAAQLAKLVRSVAARRPSQGAAAEEIAGGVAAFLAPRISTSRAAGLGMSGPVSSADVEALVRFYHARNTCARILVSPFAHLSLFEQLGEHGFRLAFLDTVLARRIAPDDRFEIADPTLEIRVAGLEDAARWVATSLRSWGVPDDEDGRKRAALLEAGFGMEDTAYVHVLRDGEMAGTAGLQMHTRTAYLFAGSTAEAHRNRGVQTALIQARLAMAQAAGCDVAFAGTAAGAGSQRNFERLGFSITYSHALMFKPVPAP